MPAAETATTISHEFSELIFTEKCLLISALILLGAYGIHLTLFLQCFHLLLRDKLKQRLTYFFMVFTSSNFILGTLYVASESIVTQYTFIDYARRSGRPFAFYISDSRLPIQLLGIFSAILGNWFADCLLLWRGFVVYQGSRLIYIMILPVLIFLGSFATPISLLIQVYHPNLRTISNKNFQLPYAALTFSLDILVAILISARLLSCKRKMSKVLGTQHARRYTSIAATIIESATLDMLFAIPYLVLYGINHPAQVIILQLLLQIKFVSALLIIYRVAHGRAWSSRTTAILSSGAEETLKYVSQATASTPSFRVEPQSSDTIYTNTDTDRSRTKQSVGGDTAQKDYFRADQRVESGTPENLVSGEELSEKA